MPGGGKTWGARAGGFCSVVFSLVSQLLLMEETGVQRVLSFP